MKKIIWESSVDNNGLKYSQTNLESSDELYKKALAYRISMIDKLASASEEFAEILLDKYNMNFEMFDDNMLLETHLRKTNLNCSITPVLCGSSFKNIGVQLLMDSIIKYLPKPSELDKNKCDEYYYIGLQIYTLN